MSLKASNVSHTGQYVPTRIGVTLQRDADDDMGPGKYEIVRNPGIQPDEVAKHHSIPRAQRFNDKPDPDTIKRPAQVCAEPHTAQSTLKHRCSTRPRPRG